MWLKLERALFSAFKERLNTLPKANAHVDRMGGHDAFKYFSKQRVNDLLDDLGKRRVRRTT